MTRPVPLRPRSASADVRKTVSRGASGRVADVHGQARRGLLVAAAFIPAAVVAGLTRTGAGWWLPLHLFLVGGLLSAVSATTQMLAVSWSAAPAPSRLEAGSQRCALAAGAVALVVGRETDRTWTFVAGGTTVVVSMLALVPILLRIRREAVTSRFRRRRSRRSFPATSRS